MPIVERTQKKHTNKDEDYQRNLDRELMKGLIAAASGGGSGANYEKFSNPSEDDGDNHSRSSSPNLLEKVYLVEALDDDDTEEDAVPFNL